MSGNDHKPQPVSPLADLGLSLQTAFTFNPHFRTGSDSLSTSPLSSTSGSPTSSPSSTFHGLYRKHRFSGSTTDASRSRSRSPFTLHSATSAHRAHFLLPRRPSAVDLALSEERSRCDEDSIERLGLSLMEPRPVDSVSIAMDLNASVLGDLHNIPEFKVHQGQTSRTYQPPRFVMGGIFEVMEGQAWKELHILHSFGYPSLRVPGPAIFCATITRMPFGGGRYDFYSGASMEALVF